MRGQRGSFALVISAPSGAGKTSIARSLVERHGDVVFSVSATTRRPRPREESGRDYHFVTPAEFDELVAEGMLAEWAVVHGERYGTLRREVVRALERGLVVVLDIDVQGARQIRESFPDAAHVFVLPPSGRELSRRLEGRGSEREAERRRRLLTARGELAAADEFDYVLVNDELETAVAMLEAIVAGERQRVKRVFGVEGGLQSVLQRLDRELVEILERSE